ncbi:UPF0496 protein 1 [Apostasia shenzhenica]|uniref:UPF0496 protein 1 n=1 Tax=Apostasia shenzhenica TaxID=1088818 RepID=A0A2I0ARU2_9ASPA|nr:UPF0496 protein 1 [Apostasia shenzhenica]
MSKRTMRSQGDRAPLASCRLAFSAAFRVIFVLHCRLRAFFLFDLWPKQKQEKQRFGRERGEGEWEEAVLLGFVSVAYLPFFLQLLPLHYPFPHCSFHTMGSQFSRRRDSAGSTSSVPGAAAGISQYTAELSSYEAACRVDPEIQTFDAGLQRRTSRAISNLAGNVQLRSLSFDTLREVTGCLLETNQDVVRIILDCKKDIWKNSELFDLVEDYFENSLQTLDFCNVLEKCLKSARDSQLIVQLALHRFDDEVAAAAVAASDQSPEENGRAKCEKTLEELKLFKSAGNPFTDEFFNAFESVYTQQLSMLEKLHHRKIKIEKKFKSVRAWRKVSCVIFASALAALLICSMVAAIVAAPPVAAALAAASSIPIGSMGKWVDSMWREYQNVLTSEKQLTSTMQAGTFFMVADLDSIRILVNRLEDQINSLLENAEFAFTDEEAVRFGIHEIRKKMGVFMKSIEDLLLQADRCSRNIRRARTVVLQRIIKLPQ